ncbi:hypothetical protein [Synechococcus lacustris]|uniref:hypothetical protein n=1 Tax=Synechococcus lacustris TaxID=2116544 RepID=UPI0010575D6A|nr:hypothetical protein [Synechococcus lacustris]
MVVLHDRFRVSQRRACRLTGQHRNTQRRPVPPADIEEQKLKRRILELARRHVRWGRRLDHPTSSHKNWSKHGGHVTGLPAGFSNDIL